MLIDQGIAMLSITAPVLGRMDTIHPVLLWNDQDLVLIDTGFPRQTKQLQAEAASYGVDLGQLNRIIITHQDIDHIGNLQDLVEGSHSRIEVSAHAIEKPYIQGDKRLLRFTDEAIASLDHLPDTVPESFRVGLRTLMLNPPRATVDLVIADGDRLPWCGGIIIIDTPGHTPGHISLYHEASRTLIAGDALTVRDGQLWGTDLSTTLDQPTAQASIAKLTAFDIKSVVCYHGGLFNDNVGKRLAELACEKE
ncbi:MBL fold metallo-hydrolase [Cohnella sp. WQ 127256]|uniref:MBL fold metallo-hydrolase n=1 Tax=Cohnella sp. WQ 127256 TaxID=2938790 RepID=UPI00355675E6